MEKLTLETFKTKIFDFEKSQEWKFQGSLPTIIDFYADWCGPCQALQPILEDIQRDFEGRLQIYQVDTDASPELAALFGVKGIPTLLFIPLTGEPAMSSGFMPRESMDRALQELLMLAN